MWRRIVYSVRRLLRWIDQIDNVVLVGLLEIALVLLLFSIWQLVEDEWRVVFIVLLFVFLVRYAARIRYIRFFWVGMFGEHHFWEWVQLLCAPLLVSVVGVMIATRINQKQGDLAVIGDRLDISADFFRYMQALDPADADPQRPAAGASQNPQSSPSDDEAEARQAWLEEYESLLRSGNSSELDEKMVSENCDPQRDARIPSLLYSKTAAALSALTELKTSEEQFSPTKKSIIQALYYSGLIKRGSHIVSLEQSDLSESRVSNIDLSWSCMDSVNLSNSYLRMIKVSDSNIRRSMFGGSDLRSAKLARTNLLGSDFRQANLDRANLEDAYLKDSNLSFASLEHANLKGAVLRGAKLRSSILINADLSNADLRGADLSGTDLRGANMNGAKIGNTKFRDAVYNTKQTTNEDILKIWNSSFAEALVTFLDPVLKVEDLKPRPIKIDHPWYPVEMWDEFPSMHLQNDAKPARKPKNISS